MNRTSLGGFLQIAGLAALLAAGIIAASTVFMLPKTDWPKAQRITCVNNLKQIGIGFATWALDHQGQYSFNVTTNVGGTLELCARGPDGYDSNAAVHFQVMSNELTNPLILLCPQDRRTKPAPDFASLGAQNVTHRLRSGTNISETHPREEIVKCPIHGNILRCDGTVTVVTTEPQRWRPAIFDLVQFNPAFGLRLIEAASAALVGCVLLFSGNALLRRDRRERKVG